MVKVYQTWRGLSRKEEISVGYEGLGIKKIVSRNS